MAGELEEFLATWGIGPDQMSWHIESCFGSISTTRGGLWNRIDELLDDDRVQEFTIEHETDDPEKWIEIWKWVLEDQAEHGIRKRPEVKGMED